MDSPEYTALLPCMHPKCPKTAEHWRPVRAFEWLYAVSDHGRLFSHGRTLMQWNYLAQRQVAIRRPAKLLRPSVKEGGYLGFTLVNAEGRKTYAALHLLVLSTFLLNAEPGQVCNHKDADPGNAHLVNLEWTTQLDNLLQAANQGKPVWQRKRLDIPRILELWATGITIKAIAAEVNAGSLAVGRVIKGIHWQQDGNPHLLPSQSYHRVYQGGGKHSQAKHLDIADILAMHHQGASKRAIGLKHGIAPGTVKLVIKGEHWSQQESQASFAYVEEVEG